jgi:hypothetical protein
MSGASQLIAGFEVEDRDGKEGDAENGHHEVEHGLSLFECFGQPSPRCDRMAMITPAAATNAAMLSANSATARQQLRP